MTLQLLLPMGGLGQRFREVGIQTPKPLIEVDGVPMFSKALDSFASFPDDLAVTVVVRTDDDAHHDISGAVRSVVPDAVIVPLDHDTQGAVETALAARVTLDPTQPIVVLDCDIAFVSPDYIALIASSSAFDGVLLTFESVDPRYSFVELDPEGRALRTAEKVAISSHALMGAYYFRTAEIFLNAADAVMAEGLGEGRAEFFMSLLFNILLEGGQAVGVASGDFYCFGTPEELAFYRATGLPVNQMSRDGESL